MSQPAKTYTELIGRLKDLEYAKKMCFLNYKEPFDQQRYDAICQEIRDVKSEIKIK